MAVLIAGACAFLIVRPTSADTGSDTTTPTHRVWMSAYGIFELKKFGDFCMPGEFIAHVPNGEVVSVIDTKTCKEVPYDFKKVIYQQYSGWMWDFTLQDLDPEEVALLLQELPVNKEEFVNEDDYDNQLER